MHYLDKYNVYCYYNPIDTSFICSAESQGYNKCRAYTVEEICAFLDVYTYQEVAYMIRHALTAL